MKTKILNTFKGWNFSDSEIQIAREQNIMLNPSIDFTNACDLNCPYCYIEEKNSIRKVRKPDELSLAETINIINDISSLGAKTINIVGAGEPTIDQHCEKIISHIYSLGMTTVLFTNGIRISKRKEFAKFLYYHDVTVVLKMNSLDERVQNLMAGKKGYHEKTNKALTILIDLGFNKNLLTRLSINCVACKGNFAELSKIHRFCRENNIYPMMGDFIPTGRTDSGHFVAENAIASLPILDQRDIKVILTPLSNEERYQLFSDLYIIDKEYGIVRSGCPAYYGGSICTQILGLYIDICGNIWPCVARAEKTSDSEIRTNFLLGRIRENANLKDIWINHIYMKNIRQNFNGGCPYKAELVVI